MLARQYPLPLNLTERIRELWHGTRRLQRRRRCERPAPVAAEVLEQRLLLSAGDLDPTFSFDGKTTTDFEAGSDDSGRDVAVQSDGRIVVAGFTNAGGSGRNFGVVRYNSNGTLDTTFSFDGKVATDFADGDDQAHAVAIQADGRIVVAGWATVPSGSRGDATSVDFALARYNADGTLDATFGGDGRVTTAMGRPGSATIEEISSVAIQADGKIVVAGIRRSTPDDFDSTAFALARYNADGSLDTTFDDDGRVITAILGGAFLNDLVIQPDGKLVVAGSSSGDYALARYNTNGSLDDSFGSDGLVLTDFPNLDGESGGDRAFAIALQADGRIVAAGTGNHILSPRLTLARYNPDGSLDPNFHANGKFEPTDAASPLAQGRGVAIQNDGNIIVAGPVFTSTVTGPVVRLLPDGGFDPTFGSGGVAPTTLNFSVFALAMQANGNVVVAGTDFGFNAGDDDFAVARYDGVSNLGPFGAFQLAGDVNFLGTDGDDEITITSLGGGTYKVLARGGQETTFYNVTSIEVQTLGGNDTVIVENLTSAVHVDLGDGDDVLTVSTTLLPFTPDPPPPGVPGGVRSAPPPPSRVDAGRGDDHVSMHIFVHPALEVIFNPQPDPPHEMLLGYDLHGDEGDDQFEVSFTGLGDAAEKGLLPAVQNMAIDGGAGADVAHVRAERIHVARGGALSVSTGRTETANLMLDDLQIDGTADFALDGASEVGIVVPGVIVGAEGSLTLGGETRGDMRLNANLQDFDVQGTFSSFWDIGGAAEVGLVPIDGGKVGPQGSLTFGVRTGGDLSLNANLQDFDVQGTLSSSWDIGGAGDVAIVPINGKVGPQGRIRFAVDALDGHPSTLNFRGEGLDIAGDVELDFATGAMADDVGIAIVGSKVTSANSLRASVRTSDGDDRVNVALQDNQLIHGHRDIDISTGRGGDTVSIVSQNERASESSLDSHRVDTGQDDDAAFVTFDRGSIDSDSTTEIRISGRQGDDTQTTAVRDTTISAGSTLRIEALGEGGRDRQMHTEVRKAVEAGSTSEVIIDGGSGDDAQTVIRTDWRVDGGSKDHTLVQAGIGADTVTVNNDRGLVREGSTVNVVVDGSSGDDRGLVRDTGIRQDTGGHFATHVDGGAGNNDIRHETDPDPRPAKFYVPDATALNTYLYDAPPTVGFVGTQPLATANTAPQGAALHPDGSRYYTIDQTGEVFVYDAAGNPLGSWTASGLSDPEGIATDGANIFIVDNGSDSLLGYAGGGSFTSGVHAPAGGFALAAANTEPRGVTVDGMRLWIVDDQALDSVFVYDIDGAVLGQWEIDRANSSPTGITIDPQNVRDIWIVDAAATAIFQYDGGATLTAGAFTADATYALETGNRNPQGIADPAPPEPGGDGSASDPSTPGADAPPPAGSAPDISGDYMINGRRASIQQLGVSLTFANERGEVSRGRLLSATQVVADDWEAGLPGRIDGGRIEWANGTTWSAPDVSCEYAVNGLRAAVQQSGKALTFINERGDVSSGRFLSGTRVVAVDWQGGLVGQLVGARIEWANGTTWSAPDVSGTYLIDGQLAGIQQSGHALTFRNERGEVSRGRLLSERQVMADDWAGGLSGEIVDGRVVWANGSTWGLTAEEPLDHAFATLDDWFLAA